ncbi:hypothetical protein FHY52_39030, partial [Nocardia nova]
MSTSSDSRPEHIDERESAHTEKTGAPAPSEKGARKLPRPRAALTWVRGHRAGVGAGLLGGLAAASV